MTAPNPDDQRLIERFNELTRHMSVRQAGEFVGVSHTAVQDYRSGKIRSLYPETRGKIEAAVRELTGQSQHAIAWSQGLIYAAEELERIAGVLRARAAALDEPGGADDLPREFDDLMRRFGADGLPPARPRRRDGSDGDEGARPEAGASRGD